MPYRRKHRTFSSLSRRSRRRKVIHIKNLIHNERHRCGGIFYDECDFTQFDYESDRIWEWSDIYFTGLDPADFWNAEIITAQVAFRDAYHARGFDEAYEMLSEQERENEFKINTYPNYNSQGDIISQTLVRREACKYDAFGGLTFLEFLEKRELEIVINDPPAIHCGYKFLPDYAYGLGLRMIVDVPSLSQKVIEDVIADFRTRGEREWHSPEAVFFSGDLSI
ncbi:hypothetical protein QVH37_10025 [Enterobacter pseudoroggenkampii]|uniref:hypothetical protein n=1 Tax=Enterobacter pseudoroggenkampii TaxID=2996112 RepID=UPI0025B069A5|nr:hypothetical protein [Enterobacter pseudoroggenkampii]WJW96580.1 hypothetical protein QVH37_10025 [Enterobacter pseudoroggenkampii]